MRRSVARRACRRLPPLDRRRQTRVGLRSWRPTHSRPRGSRATRGGPCPALVDQEYRDRAEGIVDELVRIGLLPRAGDRFDIPPAREPAIALATIRFCVL